jgi:hypothetical protein
VIRRIKRLLELKRYGELNYSIKDKHLYKEFKKVSDAESWGVKYYKEWAEKYKEIMRVSGEIMSMSISNSSIECYCGNSYREINEYLRFEKDSESNKYRELSHILTIVLCSAPRIPEYIVVYRLVCDAFVEELISKNKNLYIPTQEKGFISTSLVPGITNSEEGYACHKNLLKIYVPKNTVGVYVNTVTSRSEQEILLAPNGFLGMASYPYEDKGLDKTVYECQLIYMFT